MFLNIFFTGIIRPSLLVEWAKNSKQIKNTSHGQKSFRSASCLPVISALTTWRGSTTPATSASGRPRSAWPNIVSNASRCLPEKRLSSLAAEWQGEPKGNNDKYLKTYYTTNVRKLYLSSFRTPQKSLVLNHLFFWRVSEIQTKSLDFGH